MNDLKQLSAEFKEAVQALYGNQLARVILYGSCARGEATAESDVDFAVILRHEPSERWREIERMYPITSYLSVKYNRQISPMVLTEQRLQTSQNLFVHNVRQGGVAL